MRRIVSGYWPALAAGAVALGLCAWQLTLRHALTGMHGADDGTYLGAGLRLAQGYLPYRDFAFVHPPGIALLSAPYALLSERDAMAAGRVVTALVTGANAVLAAVAVRSRGSVAMLVAGLVLAVFPPAVAADHTLTLEPYFVFFCLFGVVALFDNAGRVATPRRVLVAGALLGFAVAVKLWAVFPALVALAVCMPLSRRAVRPFAAGLVLGFSAPVLPFFVVAPVPFVHDVIGAQIHRRATGGGFTSLGDRLVSMLGLAHAGALDSTKIHVAEALSALLVVFVLSTFLVVRRSTSRLEWFALGTTAVVAAALLLVRELYDYYGYLEATFGGMLLGVCLARVAGGLRRAGGARAAFASLGLPAIVVLAAAAVIPTSASYGRFILGGAYDPGGAIAATIPKGSCAVADYAGDLIDGNRFSPTARGCPPLVDAFGLWLTDNHGVPPPQPPRSAAFVAKWRRWLERADYTVLTLPHSDYVPWTEELTAWFSRRYRLVVSRPSLNVYRHVR